MVVPFSIFCGISMLASLTVVNTFAVRACIESHFCAYLKLIQCHVSVASHKAGKCPGRNVLSASLSHPPAAVFLGHPDLGGPQICSVVQTGGQMGKNIILKCFVRVLKKKYPTLMRVGHRGWEPADGPPDGTAGTVGPHSGGRHRSRQGLGWWERQGGQG